MVFYFRIIILLVGIFIVINCEDTSPENFLAGNTITIDGKFFLWSDFRLCFNLSTIYTQSCCRVDFVPILWGKGVRFTLLVSQCKPRGAVFVQRDVIRQGKSPCSSLIKFVINRLSNNNFKGIRLRRFWRGRYYYLFTTSVMIKILDTYLSNLLKQKNRTWFGDALIKIFTR